MMTEFRIDRLDHVHVEVADRDASAEWFGRVLGLVPASDFASWSDDPKGPLFLQSHGGNNCLALFARSRPATRSAGHTVAFRVDGAAFLTFVERLSETNIRGPKGTQLSKSDIVDHQLAWSLYFTDPDGNRFELTTYDHAHVLDCLDPSAPGTPASNFG